VAEGIQVGNEDVFRLLHVRNGGTKLPFSELSMVVVLTKHQLQCSRHAPTDRPLLTDHILASLEK